MAYPEKTERNKEIYKKRQMGWSYRKLSAYYGINVKAIFDICKRYEKR